MKKEIRCPQCGTAIQIDEATHESIVSQIKQDVIEDAVAIRTREIEARYAAAIETAKEATRAEMMVMVNNANTEYKNLQAQHQHLLTESAKMYQAEERRIYELQNELNVNASRQEAAVNNAINTAVNAEREKSHAKDMQIAQLQAALKEKELEMEAKSQNIAFSAQGTINALKSEIENLKAANIVEMNAQRDAHRAAIQAKDEEIAHYRDFRARQSVKLLGESLEEHCRIEYENIRALLPNASFNKDNVVSASGSKGDYIFREKDAAGSPLLSIMFEMKTEEETSKNKHKNEDFLKELDKDRREKECEYAVLVTTLEPESEYYNRGIVDVTHKYPKMLVIRPQFFLPLLLLLRSVAEDKSSLNRKIEQLEHEQLNASTLEHDLKDFKESVLKCHLLSTANRDKAIKRIDSAIKLLEETKDDLIKMDKHLATAKNKAESVTIQKLAKNYPMVFAEDDTASADESGSVDSGDPSFAVIISDPDQKEEQAEKQPA